MSKNNLTPEHYNVINEALIACKMLYRESVTDMYAFGAASSSAYANYLRSIGRTVLTNNEVPVDVRDVPEELFAVEITSEELKNEDEDTELDEDEDDDDDESVDLTESPEEEESEEEESEEEESEEEESEEEESEEEESEEEESEEEESEEEESEEEDNE